MVALVIGSSKNGSAGDVEVVIADWWKVGELSPEAGNPGVSCQTHVFRRTRMLSEATLYGTVIWRTPELTECGVHQLAVHLLRFC